MVINVTLFRRGLFVSAADRGRQVHLDERDQGPVLTTERDSRVAPEAAVVAKPRNYSPRRSVGGPLPWHLRTSGRRGT